MTYIYEMCSSHETVGVYRLRRIDHPYATAAVYRDYVLTFPTQDEKTRFTVALKRVWTKLDD